MRLTIKKRTLATFLQAVVAVLLLSVLFMGPTLSSDFAAAVNITNNSVRATVNVTNTEPNITSVVVDDDISVPANQIDLSPMSTKRVYCNATVQDYNGAGDINASSVNATLFISSMGSLGAPDNNHRYVNDSCGSCNSLTATTTICDCSFAVQYYANDSSEWVCNVSLKDNGGTAAINRIILSANQSSSTPVTINKLLAINTTSLLDYGNLSVTQTSPEIVHNVTNGGNINLNLSLRGFGGANDSADFPGYNLTMICDFGNISVGHQRYALGTENSGASYESMNVLLNTTRPTNFSLPSRIDDTNFGFDRNSTLWRLRVPLSVGGICNGTIIFGALEDIR
jgi:hypothetical protein